LIDRNPPLNQIPICSVGLGVKDKERRKGI